MVPRARRSARPVVPAQDRPETVHAGCPERSERLKAAPGTFHHAPVKAKPHAVADCPPAAEQGPDGRQVNPAGQGGSAGTEGRRACPPPAPLVPLAGGQDFLARPRARPRDSDSAPRGLLMDLSWTCRRALRLTARPGAAPPGCAGQISLSPAHPQGEGHSQMEGFQIEGGPRIPTLLDVLQRRS